MTVAWDADCRNVPLVPRGQLLTICHKPKKQQTAALSLNLFY